jgi:hypothetical protein
MADIGQSKKSPADYIDTSKIAEALNVNMEGVPGATDISKIKERVTTPQAATTELGSLAEQEQRLRKVVGELESGREKALKIGEAGVAEYAADRATQIKQGQEQIKLENPYPKFIPTQENVQSLSTLFSLLGVIAIGGGSKNKLSAMGAINSMTGMLKGWREGRADLWKQEQIKFEKDMAQVKANLDSAARDADLALKMLPYDVRKAEAMMQELVAKTGSQILTQKANLQGVQEAAKYVKEIQSGFKEAFEQNLKTAQLQEVKRGHDITAEHYKDVREHQRTVENRANYQYFSTPEGKVFALDTKNADKPPKEITGISGDVTKLGAGGKGSSAQVTSERVMQQDIGNAVFNLKDLKNIGEKEGKVPGGSVAFAGKFTGDISSYIKRYIETQTIDADPQTIDALMTNLAFDIASAQTGGRGQLSDTKVRAVVSQMPLESQPEATKKARWRAVVTRVDEANKTLPDNKKIEIPADVRKYFGLGDEQSSAPSGPKEGDKNVSKSGRPIIFTNGKWEYQ